MNLLMRHAEKVQARVLQGACFASAMTLFLLFLAGPVNPGMLRWKIYPLLVVTVTGAAGGLIFYLTDPWRRQGGWRRIGANLISLLLYGLLVAAAFIFGLNGVD